MAVGGWSFFLLVGHYVIYRKIKPAHEGTVRIIAQEMYYIYDLSGWYNITVKLLPVSSIESS
jgi:hypothetical protein